jgi:lipoprotein NlpD
MSLTTPSASHATRAAASALVVLVLLAACASPRRHQAPVEDRTSRVTAPPTPAPLPVEPAASAPSGTVVATPADATPPPGIENAGKPGYYMVKPGDTMMRIGLETGQNWRDIVRWNNLDNPNVIEVGQVLRVVPPGVDAAAVAPRGVAPTRVEPRPLDAKPPPPGGAASAPVAAAAAPAVAPPPVAAATAASAPSPTPSTGQGDEDINWIWPSSGPVVATFDEARYKGLAIAGKAGDPVLAAADGRVVYAGSGLRGYGNLVIVKHNNTYLTAYAHNQSLLVKEDQPVRRGQKIAEMGSSDSDRVQLHFEIRRLGKPIDPTRLLPQR